jgi:acyl-coenzyme A thioesterase PaaI-like protein
MRLFPELHHTNSTGIIHGGITLGLIDVSLFAAMYLICGTNPSGSSTLDLSTQFISAGDMQKPLDVVIDVLRETGRLGFLRGLVVQDDITIASFAGTVRKASTKR